MVAGVAFALVTCIGLRAPAGTNTYPWLEGRAAVRSVARDIPVPKGYVRTQVESGSFADWLRNLPLKEAGAQVLLFDGRKKPNQFIHEAVVDIDTGAANLQQCADAIMRLRAEYLFSLGMHDSIRFNFTNGNPALFARWRQGYRPLVKANTVRWERKAKADSGYRTFRSYMDTVFKYAGTDSLSREMEEQADVKQMRIGDIFIRGGFPGHAVIVVDMAENRETGDKVFMIAQSYMPAQDIHILKNLNDPTAAPWYSVAFGDQLRTPEWEFSRTQLKCFKNL